MKNVLNEWSIQAPWGRILLISWGDPKGKPILLVHGRQDSAVTFVPLLEHLPDKYYYVGFDFPGHGRSDAFPIGLAVTRFHFVTAIELVVKHLKWKKYVFLGHSMGGELGLFYNVIHPKEVTKFVHLDVGPALQSIQHKQMPQFYQNSYETYYAEYTKGNHDDRVYTKRKALDAVKNARFLNEHEAEMILSRNLNCIGEDKYKLSWDRRLKYAPTINLPLDYYKELFTKNVPPTLFISATLSKAVYANKPGDELISYMERNSKHFYVLTVDGTHDVHFTNPEIIAKCVCAFLDRDFGDKSKL